MNLSTKHFGLLTSISLFWFQYIGILCFMYGFFPIKNPVGGYSSEADFQFFPEKYGKQISGISHIKKPNRMIGQLVFMVIDALRVDFVFTDEQLSQSGIKLKRSQENSNGK